MYELDLAHLTAAYDAITVTDIRRSATAKWNEYDDDVLAAWVAEMDFPLAPAVSQALTEAVARHHTGYLASARINGLPQAAATWLARTAHLEVDPDQIKILPDILRGLTLSIDLFAPPSSPILLLTPSYPPFFEVIKLSGHPLIEVPLHCEDGYYSFDLEAIEGALRDGARTVVLCNPHNPVGRVYTRSELLALSTLVEQYGARVIADEVHAPLVYPGATYTAYATLSPETARHSVTLISASKAWNVPGLKCAQIILTNTDDLPLWQTLSYLRTYGSSILGVVANVAAYTAGDSWLQGVLAYLDGNRSLLAELLTLQLPSVNYRPPEGTYLAWLDCTALGLENPAKHFLTHARVAVNDGATFGAPYKNFIRLNLATPRPILREIVVALAASVAGSSAAAQ